LEKADNKNIATELKTEEEKAGYQVAKKLGFCWIFPKVSVVYQKTSRHPDSDGKTKIFAQESKVFVKNCGPEIGNNENKCSIRNNEQKQLLIVCTAFTAKQIFACIGEHRL